VSHFAKCRIFLILFFVLLFSGLSFAAEYPRPIGYVNDFAGVIPEDFRTRMEAIATELQQKTGAEIAVATVKTTGGMDIHGYSLELFTRWGIGKKGKDNGLLIVAAIDDRRLWIKTGYGLEEIIPDAIASQIYRNVLRPQFARGEYGPGLLAAVQIIAGRIADQAGVKLDSLGEVPALPQDNAQKRGGPVVEVLGWIIAVMIFLLFVGRFWTSVGPRSGRHGGFPFWMLGGFSGGMKGGGFGGGFGGFGGGSAGGGGAGGGW